VKSHVYRVTMEAGLSFFLGAICAVFFVRTMYVLGGTETRPLWTIADKLGLGYCAPAERLRFDP
jgi:hypothetical protein